MNLPNLNQGIKRNMLVAHSNTFGKNQALVPSSRKTVNFLRGLSTNYTCDSATNLCECKGVVDCLDMIFDGECQGDLQICGSDGCVCEWHASNDFRNSATLNNGFEMGNKFLFV